MNSVKVKTSKTINVCLSCDENYARYAGVVIASVLVNATATDELTFYILDGGIAHETKEKILSLKSIKDCEINFVRVDENLFDDYKSIKTTKHITLPTYFRLKVTELLPNVEKIIYFDCDMVVNTSLKPLFETDLDGAPIGGVLDEDSDLKRKNPTYINAGMIVFDLKKIRELGVEKEFLEYTKANAENIVLGDQEIINSVLNGNRIKILDEKWHVQVGNFWKRSSFTRTPSIIHYIGGQKPWVFGSRNVYINYFKKYIALTPWANEAHGFISHIASYFFLLCWKPMFMFRKKFWRAVYLTYIKKEK